jgi:hypothetical protein
MLPTYSGKTFVPENGDSTFSQNVDIHGQHHVQEDYNLKDYVYFLL